jgi:hypothetical protein
MHIRLRRKPHWFFWFAIFGLCIWITGCSTAPAEKRPVQIPVSAPKMNPPVADATSKPANEINAILVKQGYQVVKRNDQVLYCRQEIVTGTTFKNKVCLTEEQVKNKESQANETRRQLGTPQNSAGCGPLPCS